MSAVNAAIGAGFGKARPNTSLLGFGAKPLGATRADEGAFRSLQALCNANKCGACAVSMADLKAYFAQYEKYRKTR